MCSLLRSEVVVIVSMETSCGALGRRHAYFDLVFVTHGYLVQVRVRT